MSFHPHDVARRARYGSVLIVVLMAVLLSAFFRAQVVEHERYALQSEENRLRAVPLPAPRGIIYDRHGNVIAENLPAYTVSVLAPTLQGLREELRRLGTVIDLTETDVRRAERLFRREPNRPTVIFPDATIDLVAVLEEHRVDFPSLIIQSVPKRYYPDGETVSAFVGYTSEISEAELASQRFSRYKMGQVIGKDGLERQYEEILHGVEGMQFVEVDARGRIIQTTAAIPGTPPQPAAPLQTNIDLNLQRWIAEVFGDSLIGGVVAIEPKSGGVLALYSAPGYDPNRFTGGIPADYWRQLNTDPKRPLYNKAVQGTYPPGSTWKLIDAVIALQAGLIEFNSRMPAPCTGGYQYGNRYFRCWYSSGHGYQDLTGAIAKSCNVYFYQLGVRIGLTRMIAGGVELGFNSKAGLDLPNERTPRFPYGVEYYNRRYGPRGWTQSVVLNLAIGQAENSQTLVNMARFYEALATDGSAARPLIARTEQAAPREQLFTLPPEQMQQLRAALLAVVSPAGTAGGSAVPGLFLGGKTGTAQSSPTTPDHSWFVGMAPVHDPQIVIAVMIEFGGGGSRAARIASRIASRYLNIRHPADVAPLPADDEETDTVPLDPLTTAPVALAP
jgi:penicillin-binding protein 2